MTGQVSGIADNIVSVVPVVNQVIPSGTVTTVAAPIAQPAGDTTAAVVDVVVPPVAATLPALEPVLQPVSDVVTGSAVQPTELPELPLIAEDAEIPGDAAVVAVVASGAAEAASAKALAESSIADTPDTVGSPRVPVALAGTSAPRLGTIDAAGFSNEQPGTADPSPAPAQSPAAPGSGTGSGTASASAPGSAAVLSPFTFDLPPTGAVRAGETPEHAPAPVSFDPGSSPD